MAWTYLDFYQGGDYVLEGELLPESPQLPGPQTAYLGFDVVRNAVVIGYTERGGYHSFLGPNVDDDCNIVAFAPFTETNPPDIEEIRRRTPWKDAFLDPDGSPFRLLMQDAE